MKILVVEDNATDLKLVQSVLANAGHEISVAHSAEQAVEILETATPEVILTDLVLPRMDGLTLTHQLKQATKTAAIPIIAMTSDPDYFSKKLVQKAGFAAYLTKPLNTRTLSRQVTDAVKPD